MKTAERELARRLRASGLSIKDIARSIGCAQSSVSVWVRDVTLTDEQRRTLDGRRTDNRLKGSKANSARARDRRRAYQDEGRARTRQGDSLHLAGSMLFWAEGSRQRNVVYFTNSDAAMARVFVRFLTDALDVDRSEIRISCNLFADHAERQLEVEQFWLSELGLPDSCLRRSTIDRYSKYSEKKRRNRLPHGTVRIAVNSTAVVQHVYGAIQEYGGFDRPEWLD